MWELDYKESWASKNWCFWTVVLEKTLESPLDYKEIQPGRSLLGVHWRDWCWSSNSNTLATWCRERTHLKKEPDAGKDWGQEEKGMAEDELVGWHHWHNGHGFGWTPAVGDGQGGLVCYGSWCCKESDMTERVNWTELIYKFISSANRDNFQPAIFDSSLMIWKLYIFLLPNSCT